MKNYLFLGVSMFVLLSTACSTSPVLLSNEYTYIPDSGDNKILSENLGKVCQLNIVSIKDVRSNHKYLGNLGLRPVYVDDIIEWIKNWIRILEKDGYYVSFNQEDKEKKEKSIDVEIELKKAYIRSIATTKSSSLVLGVRFFKGQNLLNELNYRGSDTCINWASSEEEINNSFNRSFSSILTQMRSDIESYCNEELHDKYKAEN
jgi:hypothetical protein